MVIGIGAEGERGLDDWIGGGLVMVSIKKELRIT